MPRVSLNKLVKIFKSLHVHDKIQMHIYCTNWVLLTKFFLNQSESRDHCFGTRKPMLNDSKRIDLIFCALVNLARLQGYAR